MKNKISVIIPCYNAAKYINICFDSIKTQTYGIDNLEIIFVDDVSSDNTLEVLEKIESCYPDNVLIVKCENNGGPGSARNIGMSYATGDYISFVDSDDCICESMLEELFLLAESTACDYAECEYLPVDSPGICTIYQDTDAYSFTVDLTVPHNKKVFLSESLKTAVWGRLYKRDFLFSNHICFPDNVLYEEDVYFSAMCMFHADKYAKTGKKLYMYYQNPNSIVHSEYNSKRVRSEINIIRILLNDLDARGMLDDILSNYFSELEFFCIWKGYLDPLRSILSSTMAEDDKYSEIAFFAQNITSLFPNAVENVNYAGYKDDFFDLSRKLLTTFSS